MTTEDGLIAKEIEAGLKHGDIAKKYNVPKRRVRAIRTKYRDTLNLPGKSVKSYMNQTKFDVDIEWLKQFKDWDKYRFLLTLYSNKWNYTTDQFKQFIVKFYYDETFNRIYKAWRTTKDRWLKPSIDHRVAKTKNGTNDLDNLQCLTWFANRAKNNMSEQAWERIKSNIHEYI